MADKEPILDYRLSRILRINGLPELYRRLENETRPYKLRVQKRDAYNLRNRTVNISLMTDSVDNIIYSDDLVEDLKPGYNGRQ